MWRDFFLNFNRILSLREKIFNIWFAFGFSFAWMLIVLFIKAMVVGPVTGEVGTCWIGTHIDKILATMGFGDHGALVVRAVVLAPLIEEHLFRCFPLFFLICFPVLDKRASARLLLEGVLFSSILFGLMHGSAWNVALQGVMGVVLCWVYLKNNLSRWSPIIVHALYNLAAIIFTILVKSSIILNIVQ